MEAVIVFVRRVGNMSNNCKKSIGIFINQPNKLTTLWGLRDYILCPSGTDVNNVPCATLNIGEDKMAITKSMGYSGTV
jgi:hypothetical protein